MATRVTRCAAPALFALALCAACRGEDPAPARTTASRSPVASSPPLGPAAASSIIASLPPPPAIAPLVARFVSVSTEATTEKIDGYSDVFIVVAKGRVKVTTVPPPGGTSTSWVEELGEADTLALRGFGALRLEGAGRVFFAAAMPEHGGGNELVKVRLVRGKDTAPLVFAKGRMRAFLDLEGEHTYVGRLVGTAPVLPHTHPGSWELIAAIEANGVASIGGASHPLVDGDIVMIAPGAEHAWQPAEGSTLRAIQMYASAGPEQRFKKLAAEDAANDAGAADASRR